MGLLREINLAGNTSQVQNFVPGDNITFATQSDGTIRINGEAGGEGGGESYTAGPGIQISPQNVISAEVRREMVAPSETSPASEAHAVWENILVDGVYYRVTSAIAVNDDIVEGANVEQTSAGEEIAALRRDITVKVDDSWTLLCFGEYFFGVRNWSSGNEIDVSTGYGNLFISPVLQIPLPQTVRSVAAVSAAGSYFGGGVGFISMSDARQSIYDLTPVKFFVACATSIRTLVNCTFFCSGSL